MKYLALLRGINVGGNNKVAMSELRACFEHLGFTEVSTYINSGNIFFSTDAVDVAVLIETCEAAIKQTFGFSIVITIISRDDFIAAVDHTPSWWGVGDRNDVRSDAMFVIPPMMTSQVRSAMNVKPDSPDLFSEYGQVIFWSLPMESYSKSIVPKIIGTPIYRHVTIRSSTTTKKLYDLFA